MTTLGIVGGLGPETGCKFCLSVNDKLKGTTEMQPHILLDNLPITKESEARLINGGAGDEHFNLIKQSVIRLNLFADVIVIPCNTVHTFINEIRQLSKVRVLSIIEETADECERLQMKKVGIIASTKTVNEGLHNNELATRGIEVITPNAKDQKFISECIIKIVNNCATEDEKQKLLKVISKMANVDGIILGCTDLPLLIQQSDLDIPLINTTKVLENAAVREMTKQLKR